MNARSGFVPAALFGVALALPLAISADAPPDLESRRIKPQEDYARAALDAYGSGQALIERAARFEHDAAAAEADHARTEALRGASLAYEDALRSFKEAVRADDRMYEAHTFIGYAHRKLGRYEDSMTAYAAALRLKPDYARAIEYQGEAYLGLDRFDDARFNYLRLYALDPAQAAKLLIAMRAWVEERESEPRKVARSDVRAASEWLQEQQVEISTTAGDDWRW